jgi:hypothetical protein
LMAYPGQLEKSHFNRRGDNWQWGMSERASRHPADWLDEDSKASAKNQDLDEAMGLKAPVTLVDIVRGSVTDDPRRTNESAGSPNYRECNELSLFKKKGKRVNTQK